MSKVVIIGAGSVGTAIAYCYLLRGSARHVFLVDVNQEKVRGEVLDLNHGRAYAKMVEIHQGTYKDCADANLVVITAGAKQKPNETRIDLLNRNISIMQSIISDILQNSNGNQPILLVVSNPCDILTFYAQQFSNFPREKVIGSGTALDSSRLRFEISDHCGINAQNVHGYVIGEHGDSEVILWNSLRIGLGLFTDYCALCKRKCYPETKQSIEKNVKNAAYEIIKTKGYTNFAIGLAVARITEAILGDQNAIIPVSTFLNGEYGENNVALSVPCIVNKNGIRGIMQIELSGLEQQQFHESAEKLRQLIKEIKNE